MSQHYLWPTDSGQYLSSTFGETRSAHFHAGLDIKTWGREGYRVFASRSGILHRLLITERGYGKAIYLKHPDGTYTVYAHLLRFTDHLQAIADSVRLQDYSFEMDVQLDSLNIEIKLGEVIGYTGSTGIGPPHLHFEVRDSLQNPVNPLSTNLLIKDRLSPVFSSLIVEPLEKNSRIEGRPVSKFRRAVKVSEDVYDFGEIHITGKAGLAVNVFDRADEVHNAYAVYSLGLLQESDTLFYEELNTFGFEASGEMYLDRIAPFGSSRRGHQRLYAKDGNQNPFYLLSKKGARIQAKDSVQTYTIVASDYFGNTSHASIKIKKDSSYKNEMLLSYNTPRNWYWAEDWASSDMTNTIDLSDLNLGIPWGEGQQILHLNDPSITYMFTRVFPDSSQKVFTPDYRMLVRFRENTFFDTLTTAVAYHTTEDKIRLSVQPQMLATKSGYGIEFFMGNEFIEGNKYRLFRLNDSPGKLSYVDSEMIGKTLHAYPDALGEFTILADNSPPVLSNFRIYQTDYGQWQGTVHVKDKLSGIKSSSAEFYINGTRGIAEYDYEEELLIFYLPGWKPDTINSAEINLEDKAGNRASATFEFRLSSF